MSEDKEEKEVKGKGQSSGCTHYYIQGKLKGTQCGLALSSADGSFCRRHAGIHKTKTAYLEKRREEDEDDEAEEQAMMAEERKKGARKVQIKTQPPPPEEEEEEEEAPEEEMDIVSSQKLKRINQKRAGKRAREFHGEEEEEYDVDEDVEDPVAKPAPKPRGPAKGYGGGQREHSDAGFQHQARQQDFLQRVLQMKGM